MTYKEYDSDKPYVVEYYEGLGVQESPCIFKEIVGFFDTKEEADKEAKKLYKSYNSKAQIKSSWTNHHFNVQININSVEGAKLHKEFRDIFDIKLQEMKDKGVKPVKIGDQEIWMEPCSEMDMPSGPSTTSASMTFLDMKKQSLPTEEESLENFKKWDDDMNSQLMFNKNPFPVEKIEEQLRRVKGEALSKTKYEDRPGVDSKIFTIVLNEKWFPFLDEHKIAKYEPKGTDIPIQRNSTQKIWELNETPLVGEGPTVEEIVEKTGRLEIETKDGKCWLDFGEYQLQMNWDKYLRSNNPQYLENISRIAGEMLKRRKDANNTEDSQQSE